MSLYGNIPQYIKLNLVQNLLGEVKEKEYFVADKMKKIFEKTQEAQTRSVGQTENVETSWNC